MVVSGQQHLRPPARRRDQMARRGLPAPCPPHHHRIGDGGGLALAGRARFLGLSVPEAAISGVDNRI